jgi:hypothetical protein
VLGDDNRVTLTTRNNLALAYYGGGQLDKAIALWEATLAATQRILGDNHSLTRTVQGNLSAARSRPQ